MRDGPVGRRGVGTGGAKAPLFLFGTAAKRVYPFRKIKLGAKGGIAMSIYDFTVGTRDGGTRSLADYKDQVLLIVNTATACGFTPQYEGLQRLYDTYKARGFQILDFPCNQFAGQAPGTNEEIHAFCTGRFGITFEQFAKIDVNGANESPLYTWLKAQKGGVLGGRIKWNFTKFLVDRKGNVVERFAPIVTPEALEKAVAALL